MGKRTSHNGIPGLRPDMTSDQVRAIGQARYRTTKAYRKAVRAKVRQTARRLHRGG